MKAHIQLWIIGEDRSNSDKNGIMLSAQAVGEGHTCLTADAIG
jgi:hypothetical protein